MRLVLNYVWIKDQLVLGSQLSVSALTSYKTRPQLQVLWTVFCLFLSCVFLLFPVDPFFFFLSFFPFQNQSHSFMLSWHLFLYEHMRVGLLIIWGEKGLKKKKKTKCTVCYQCANPKNRPKKQTSAAVISGTFTETWFIILLRECMVIGALVQLYGGKQDLDINRAQNI